MIYPPSKTTQVARDPPRGCAARQGDREATPWFPIREGAIAECCCLLYKRYNLIPLLDRVHSESGVQVTDRFPQKQGAEISTGMLWVTKLSIFPSIIHSETQYNVASLRSLPIRNTHPAAAYTDAPKRLLDRRCTMDDVADFVTDYINSDVSVFLAEAYHQPTFHRFWASLRSIG